MKSQHTVTECLKNVSMSKYWLKDMSTIQRKSEGKKMCHYMINKQKRDVYIKYLKKKLLRLQISKDKIVQK